MTYSVPMYTAYTDVSVEASVFFFDVNDPMMSCFSGSADTDIRKSAPQH